MGMFDWVTVPPVKCHEGHDMDVHGFQTKDFDCVLGVVEVPPVGGSLSFVAHGLGSPHDGPAFTGTFSVYDICDACRGRADDDWNEWKVVAVDGVVRSFIKVGPVPTKPTGGDRG